MARQKENIPEKEKVVEQYLAPDNRQETQDTAFISEEKTKEATPFSQPEIQVLSEITREVEGAEAEKEKDEGSIDKAIDSLTKRLRKPKKTKVRPIPQVRDDVTLKIEKILEEGLKDAYMELDTIQKQEFKIKGEEAAFAIRTLLKQTHVKIKSIFRLILEWLKILPGVNRFFLEQEAKIKTDKIMALHEQEKHRPS